MSLFYKNPIIHADYPDPDVIRTGDDFWMVSSSFNLLPGLPLLHSRDLINWQIVNHIVKRLPAPEYDVPQPGKGIWAPAIRFHHGRFWVFYSLPDEGIFVTHTQDPLGEWSEPYCLHAAPGYIDPCPFWDDDGRAWLVHGFAFSRSGIKNKLQLFEMAPDASRLLDPGCIIFDGNPSHPTLEGPKLYKRKGEYWLFAPAGGVKRGWQTVLRAKSLTGPWQSRDVLHQGRTAVNGPHQGAWVELQKGENWFFHFQDKGVYGRILHLQPVRWGKDGWPEIGEKLDEKGKGQPVERYKRPALPLSPCVLQTSDSFLAGKPGLQWQWLANPQEEWITPGEQGLHLTHVPASPAVSLCHLPHLLLQKFPAERFSVSTTVDLTACRPGDETGVVIYGQRYSALCIRHTDTGYDICMRYGWIDDHGANNETVLQLTQRKSVTRIELGYSVDYDGLVTFAFCLPGEAWAQVEPRFSSGAGKWIGAQMGIYARGKLSGNGGKSIYSNYEVILG